MTAQLQSYQEVFSPIVMVSVNGVAADDIAGALTLFEHEDNVKKVGYIKCQIFDDGTFTNDPRFDTDAEWSFRWGYANDMSSTRKLLLKYFEPTYNEDGSIRIDITLLDKGHHLLQVKAAKNWGSVNSSDIAKKIADRYGFKAIVEASKDARKLATTVQAAEESDFAFLHRLASKVDFEFFVDNEVLYYRSIDTAFNQEPRMNLTYIDSGTPTVLLSFKPKIKATKHSKTKVLTTGLFAADNHPHGVSTNKKNAPKVSLGPNSPAQPAHPIDKDARVPSTSESTTSVSPNGDDPPQSAIVDLDKGQIVGLTDDEVASASPYVRQTPDTELAGREAMARKRDFLTATVLADAECIGTPRIRAGATYNIQGVDRRLSGLWYSVSTKTKIQAGEYRITTELHRGAYKLPGKGAPANTVVNNKTASDPSNATSGAIEINTETLEVIGPTTSSFIPASTVQSDSLSVPAK